jgi:hypothetical protein
LGAVVVVVAMAMVGVVSFQNCSMKKEDEKGEKKEEEKTKETEEKTILERKSPTTSLDVDSGMRLPICISTF